MRTKQFILSVTTVLLLAGLWVYLKPVPDSDVAAPAAVSAASEEIHFQLVVNAGVASGSENLRVQQGQKLQIEILSDVEDAVHLHGYNLHQTLHAGKPATLQVVAENTGRFSMELHESGLHLGTLEVYPGP